MKFEGQAPVPIDSDGTDTSAPIEKSEAFLRGVQKAKELMANATQVSPTDVIEERAAEIRDTYGRDTDPPTNLRLHRLKLLRQARANLHKQNNPEER